MYKDQVVMDNGVKSLKLGGGCDWQTVKLKWRCGPTNPPSLSLIQMAKVCTAITLSIHPLSEEEDYTFIMGFSYTKRYWITFAIDHMISTLSIHTIHTS